MQNIAGEEKLVVTKLGGGLANADRHALQLCSVSGLWWWR